MTIAKKMSGRPPGGTFASPCPAGPRQLSVIGCSRIRCTFAPSAVLPRKAPTRELRGRAAASRRLSEWIVCVWLYKSTSDAANAKSDQWDARLRKAPCALCGRARLPPLCHTTKLVLVGQCTHYSSSYTASMLPFVASRKLLGARNRIGPSSDWTGGSFGSRSVKLQVGAARTEPRRYGELFLRDGVSSSGDDLFGRTLHDVRFSTGNSLISRPSIV